jgi:hypothetical protein
MDVFKKIGEQWPLVLILFCAIAVLSFRKQISIFLTNGRIKKIGPIELDNNNEEEEVESKEKKSYDEVMPEKVAEVKAVKNDGSLSIKELADLLVDEKFDEAESVFASLKDLKTNDKEKVELEIRYRYLLITLASKGDLQEFINYIEQAENVQNKLLGSYFLSLIYFQYDKFDEALILSLEIFSDLKGNNKMSCIETICDCKKELEGVDSAIKYLLEKVEDFNDGEKSVLYKRLGDLYDKKDNSFLKNIAYGKALEYNITSKSKRFDLAYSFGGERIDLITQLYHYTELTKRLPKEDHFYEIGKNNLGVTYSNLKLYGLAVEEYDSAREVGNSLSVANLAYMLMEKGFYDVAEEMLDSVIKDNEEVHKNVWSAKNRIVELRKEESDSLKDLKKVGNKAHRFFVKCFDIVHSTKNTAPVLSSESNLNLIEYDVDDKELNDLSDEASFQLLEDEDCSIEFKWENTYKKIEYELDVSFGLDVWGMANFTVKKGSFLSSNDYYSGYAIYNENVIEVIVSDESGSKFFKIHTNTGSS